ncbi:MAG: winged helix-turn-helix transcriptional regulator [Halobacteriales archaeon]
MRLRQPTDFLILEALAAYGRNVATNLSEITGKSRKNINNRLPALVDYGLVRKIGPAKHSGLYEITTKGELALGHREEYDEREDFGAFLDRRLERDTDPTPRATMLRGSGQDDE